VSEDGEQVAIHGGSILEDAHQPCPAPHFAEPPFDGVCGSDGLALGAGFVAKAGQRLVEVIAQAGDGHGEDILLSVGEVARGGSRGVWARVSAFMTLCRRALTTHLSACLTSPRPQFLSLDKQYNRSCPADGRPGSTRCSFIVTQYSRHNILIGVTISHAAHSRNTRRRVGAWRCLACLGAHLSYELS